MLVVALFVVGEVVVRVSGFGQPPSGTATDDQAAFNEADMFEPLPGDARRYRNRPGASVTVGDVTYRHDEHGLRVGDTEATADDGRPRVLFLGDSTTYGWGVSADDALPRQVARRLDERIVALNAGVSGYTTRQELAQYLALRDLDVDLVVLVVYPNDATDGALRWDPGLGLLYLDETPTPEALKAPLWRSALYRAAVAAHTRAFTRSGATSPERAENVEHVAEAARALAEAADADGRPLLAALLPVMEALEPYPFDAQRAAIAEALAPLPVVDLLTEAFLPERARQIAGWEARNGREAPATARRDFLHQYWVAPRDHHLDPAGNAVAAAPLAARIAALLGLPAPPP